MTKLETNDARGAIQLIEDAVEKIAELKLSKLAKVGYVPDDTVEDLKASHDEQQTRIKSYEVYAQEAQRLRDLNDDMYANRIQVQVQKMDKMQWQGQPREEQLLETRRKMWKFAREEIQVQLASVSTFLKWVKERVQDSIVLMIQDAIRDEEEDPAKRLQTIISTLKDQITGNQDMVRFQVNQAIQQIGGATGDEDAKVKINEMRVLQRTHRASGKLQGQTTEMDDVMLIRFLGDVVLANPVCFSAKAKYTAKKNDPGQTFLKIAGEVEKEIDSELAKANGRGRQQQNRGMDISHTQAAENQTMGKAVTGAGAKSGTKGGECFSWMREGQCMFGNNCRYDHTPSKKGTSDNRGRGRDRQSSRSRDRDDRSRSRDRGGGGGRDYDSSSRGRGGVSNNERRRSPSNSRDSGRFGNGGRHFDHRDNGRRDDASKSPEGRRRDDRGGSNGGGRNSRDRRSSSSSSSSRYSSNSDDEDSSSRSSGASTLGRGGTPKKTIQSRNFKK